MSVSYIGKHYIHIPLDISTWPQPGDFLASPVKGTTSTSPITASPVPTATEDSSVVNGDTYESVLQGTLLHLLAR